MSKIFTIQIEANTLEELHKKLLHLANQFGDPPPVIIPSDLTDPVDFSASGHRGGGEGAHFEGLGE